MQLITYKLLIVFCFYYGTGQMEQIQVRLCAVLVGWCQGGMKSLACSERLHRLITNGKGQCWRNQI